MGLAAVYQITRLGVASRRCAARHSKRKWLCKNWQAPASRQERVLVLARGGEKPTSLPPVAPARAGRPAVARFQSRRRASGMAGWSRIGQRRTGNLSGVRLRHSAPGCPHFARAGRLARPGEAGRGGFSRTGRSAWTGTAGVAALENGGRLAGIRRAPIRVGVWAQGAAECLACRPRCGRRGCGRCAF